MFSAKNMRRIRIIVFVFEKKWKEKVLRHHNKVAADVMPFGFKNYFKK